MFYKLVMNGSCRGQDIRNILYYRTTSVLSEVDFPFAGAEALAANFVQEVWPEVKYLYANDYTLDTVDVYPINDEFEMVYQMPYSLAVGEAGSQSDAHVGPASCLNIKFVLGATTILNGIVPPRRGYLAVGPIPAAWIGEDGYLTNAVMNVDQNVKDAVDAFASNVEQIIPVPNLWSPVRLKQNRILGGLIHWESWSPVKGAVLSRRASFRRSRLPES